MNQAPTALDGRVLTSDSPATVTVTVTVAVLLLLLLLFVFVVLLGILYIYIYIYCLFGKIKTQQAEVLRWFKALAASS